MARPMATRWRWPPESSRGRRSSRLADAQHLGSAVAPGVSISALGELPRPQAEGDVLEDVQIGVERVVLEHHGDVAVARAHMV